MTPWNLTVPLPSLPPILYIKSQYSMPSYSKALRGLSVLPQVTRIFTGTAISPNLSSRQRSDGYAFHARRNLPDKVFRYLRTVIVTAAVHWGLDSELRDYSLTPPRNLPALGKRRLLYIVLRLSRNLCFC
jgi:hypothetical protein